MTDDYNDSKTGSSTYNIVKLTENNYRSWAQQLEWILDERDLWEIVTGLETRPIRVPATLAAQAPIPSTSTVSTSDSEFEAKLDAYVKKSKKARSIIGSSVSAAVMTYIEGVKDPAEMWRILEERYNPKTQTTLLQTLREFMTATMESGVNMEQHLQKVQRLKRQVEEQGEKISDTVYNTILLNSVPEEYKIAVSILEAQDQLTPAIIINRIMEEYRKIGAEDAGKTKMAMLTKHRKGKSPPKNQHVCTHCQKKGHTEEKCWIAHPELRPTKSGSSKKTGKALISMKATLKVESPSDPDIWYIDSGASVHFSPHRNKFESYTPLDNPIEIETAEGTIYGIGKGTITVEAMAGSDINILQLKNVVHVPKMSANLLSSTVLYDLGFEVSMKPGQGVNILRNGEIIANTVRAGESVF